MVPLLLLGAVAAPAAATAATALQATPRDLSARPALELESGLFARPAPGRRQVLTNLLHLTGAPEEYDLSYGLSFGWVTLFESGGQDNLRSTTHGPGNLVMWGRYLLPLGSLSSELGVALVIGTTAVPPSPQRRTARSAYSHAIAMRAAWEAWLWAPDRGGLAFPARLAHGHRLGDWTGLAVLDTALSMSLPHTEFNDASVSFLLQAGLGYEVRPRDWLVLGADARFVWMPNALLFATQGSAVPHVGVELGRWRLGVELVVNLDQPYGLTSGGQRIWATQLKVGWKR